jgi:ribosomal protein S12 methylthiotransferase
LRHRRGLAENGKVIVTGCLGAREDRIRAAHPDVLAITGPHQYEAVVEEVHKACRARTIPSSILLAAARY